MADSRESECAIEFVNSIERSRVVENDIALTAK